MADSEPHSIRTERLLLRRWRESDREPWAAMNADPAVMEHFQAPLTREQSDAAMDRFDDSFDEHGFGLWAVEVVANRRFIGTVGLNVPTFEAHFTPAVEAGWRLAREAWGQGYAFEAASAALAYGFDVIDLDEIVSMTAPRNERSWRLMQRLGMTRDPADDFDHPRIADGHPLQRHVLYRLRRDG